MNKTRKDVEIPFFEDFAAYLRDLKNAASDSGYVLPEHADMYQHNPTGVSYRVKTFLEKLGITTRKEMPSRGRAVSIKDLHSVRHSFAHYAGLRGIPIATVRSILGHMSEKMTQRYQAHGKLKEKREGLKLMPEFMNLTASAQKQLPASEPERESLLEFIKNADIAIIRSIIKKHCPDVADTCSI
jgi:integrase